MQVNHVDFRPSIHPYSLTTAGGNPTDIIICVDGSNSVFQSEWEDQIDAVGAIISYYEPFLGDIKIALSSFSTGFQLYQDLTDSYTQLINTVNNLYDLFPGGVTEFNIGITKCIEILDPLQNANARNGVNKVMALTLDGSLVGSTIIPDSISASNSFKQGTVTAFNTNGISGVIKIIGVTAAADPLYVPALSGTTPPVFEFQDGVGDVLVSGGGVADQDYWFLNEFTDFIDLASEIAEQSIAVDITSVMNSGSYTSQSAELFNADGTVIPYGENIQHVEKHAFFVPDVVSSPAFRYLSLNLDENSTGSAIFNSSHFGVIVEGVIGSSIAKIKDNSNTFINSIFIQTSVVKFKHIMIRNQNPFSSPRWSFTIEDHTEYSTADLLNGDGPNEFQNFENIPYAGVFPLDPLLFTNSQGIGENGNPHFVSIGSDGTYGFHLSSTPNNCYIKGTYVLI